MKLYLFLYQNRLQLIYNYNLLIQHQMSYTNIAFRQNIGRTVDRDVIEKQRIDDRVGFQARFQTAGNLIFQPAQDSTLNITQKQRFNKNHDPNDRLKRQLQREKKDAFYQARLNKRFERDQQRWDKQSKKEEFQQKKRLHHQQVLTDNKRNHNGLGYNPISHAYQQSQRGKKLQTYDQGKEINRYVRSKNIIQKNISNFNIITGEPTTKIKQNVPQKYKNQVQQKYQAKIQRQTVKYQPIRDKYDYLDD